MVKNKKGGRHHKKMSSKHSKDTGYTVKLRLPSVEGEVIASVLQLYGQGNVNVMCDDGVERLCVIRKKFRGRHKRDNQITLHSFVLVGIRDYEVVAYGKKPKCDLLYVYSDSQKTQLQQGGHINARLLKGGEKEEDVGYDMEEGGGGGGIAGGTTDTLGAGGVREETNSPVWKEIFDDI